jgi:hypothetical protein
MVFIELVGPWDGVLSGSKEALMSTKICPNCNDSLIEIDYHGELLVGCIDCNYWQRPGDKRRIMEMLEEDLDALRACVRRRQPPH